LRIMEGSTEDTSQIFLAVSYNFLSNEPLGFVL